MKKYFYKILDIVLLPMALANARIIFLIRKIGGKKLPIVHRILYRTGVFPTKDFFFQPPSFSLHLKEEKKV